MADALVLIVEDNARNMKLARDLLQIHGFRTLEACDGETGLAMARAESPDVVLMDIQLPGMDGMAALTELRADPVTAAIPVVAVTAYAMTGDRERFLAAGFDDHITKPLDVHRFPGQVRAHCFGRATG